MLPKAIAKSLVDLWSAFTAVNQCGHYSFHVAARYYTHFVTATAQIPSRRMPVNGVEWWSCGALSSRPVARANFARSSRRAST